MTPFPSTAPDADLLAWTTSPWALAAVLVLSVAAGLVAFDLNRRTTQDTPRARRWWLIVGGGIAMGTAVWAGPYLLLAGAQQAIRIGFGGGLSLLAFALATAAAVLAFALALAPEAGARARCAAALLLAVGLLGSQGLSAFDMKMAPALQWQPSWIAIAALCVTLGSVSALQVLRLRALGPAWVARTAAATLLGLAVTGGQWAGLRMSQFALGAVSLHDHDLLLQSLGLLAWTGPPVVICSLLTLSIVKGRLRHALLEAKIAIETSERTDTLTGLPNRLALLGSLDTAARDADRRGGSMAMLFISLDDFKPVNESFGREVGDLALQEVARRLRTLVGPGGELARVGGDDFALLQAQDIEPDAIVTLARRTLDTVARPCSIDGRDLMLSCSIGMVRYPQHGAHSTMLVHGEAAAQAAKKTGGAASMFFESHMLAGAREHLDLLRDLRTAIADHQFELYYQPKIHAESGAITGAEALMRWQHPTRGMVSPGVFIPMAERHGLIGPLGDWLIDEACRQARAWRDEGLRMRVAINLSVIQLRQPDLVARIAAALRKYQINPQLLTCEITESLAMEDSNAMARFFEQLGNVGVHISIDDFGTGYSSLAYLRKLPAEELKIDRSFVLDLETSADARAVVDAVVKLAHALGLRVVAEGVETKGQHEILCGLGCDQLQGYLFAKPMSAKTLGLWAMTSDGPSGLAFRDSLFANTAPMAIA